jgi:hypothetical protein
VRQLPWARPLTARSSRSRIPGDEGVADGTQNDPSLELVGAPIGLVDARRRLRQQALSPTHVGLRFHLRLPVSPELLADPCPIVYDVTDQPIAGWVVGADPEPPEQEARRPPCDRFEGIEHGCVRPTAAPPGCILDGVMCGVQTSSPATRSRKARRGTPQPTARGLSVPNITDPKTWPT